MYDLCGFGHDIFVASGIPAAEGDGLSMDENTENMEFGPDIITLSDDDGKEYQFELLDRLDRDGNIYFAMVPVISEENLSEDDGELVILRVSGEGEDQYLEFIEDEDEFNEVSKIFMENLSDEFDFIDGEE